jgi:hypothetical protein
LNKCKLRNKQKILIVKMIADVHRNV